MRKLLTIVFSFFLSYALSQDIAFRFQLLFDCYHTINLSQLPVRAKVTLTRLSNGQDFVAVLDSSGECRVDNLVEDDYKLVAGFGDPFNADTIIHVSGNLTMLKFCLDSKYRPLSESEIQSCERLASDDIKSNRLMLYWMSVDFPLTQKESRKMQKDMKSKFGVQYIYESGTNLYSREGFTVFMKCHAYNKIVKQYLDEKFGTEWRKTWTTTEITFPLK